MPYVTTIFVNVFNRGESYLPFLFMLSCTILCAKFKHFFALLLFLNGWRFTLTKISESASVNCRAFIVDALGEFLMVTSHNRLLYGRESFKPESTYVSTMNPRLIIFTENPG